MILLKNISKIFYHKNRTITALSEVSLQIPKGKIFGIIGSSGAGKSTLIRCVNLLEKPTSGTIMIDGKNLAKLSHSELIKVRRQTGMIFQHFNLLSSRTVAQNVAFPLELNNISKESIKTRVAELLALVGLSDKENEYPRSLSGGQKQRVAIARTLANNPKILLCDEATSSLDPGTTHAILSLLKDINQRLGITILLITHEMDVVKQICDEVAVISQGKLIEIDEVSSIFSHPKTPLAQEFIASTIHLEIPDDYKNRLKEALNEGNPLLQLEFTGQSVDSPIVSEIAKRFQIDTNVISAQMDYVGGIKFGFMLTELVGEKESRDKAISLFKEKNIKVKILGYV